MKASFDEFAKEISSFDIEFVDMDVFPSNVLGGEPLVYLPFCCVGFSR